MSNSISIDTSEVIQNLDQLTPRVQAGLNTVAETVGALMKSYAQNNARWTDRTSDARNQMDYKVEWIGTTLDISIFHKMDYGYWLETRNFSIAGDLSILQEARDSQVETFKSMIKAMKL